MSFASTRNGFSDVEELAPHVEKEWARAFMVELRLRGVSGEDVRAALAEVDSYCADATVSAQEFFGDPETYADNLELPKDPNDPVNNAAEMTRGLIPTVVQIIGIVAFIYAAPSYLRAEPVEITLGALINWAVLVGVFALIAWQIRALVHFMLQRPVLAWLSFTVALMFFTIPMILFPQTVAELSVIGFVVVGAVFLVVGTVWALVRARVDVSQAQIVQPLDDPEAVERRTRSGFRMVFIQVLMFPVFGALMVAVVMVMNVLW